MFDYQETFHFHLTELKFIFSENGACSLAVIKLNFSELVVLIETT